MVLIDFSTWDRAAESPALKGWGLDRQTDALSAWLLHHHVWSLSLGKKSVPEILELLSFFLKKPLICVSFSLA